MRSSRVLPSIAALLAAASLAACTTNSQVCSDGVCKISLSGEGASSKLGGDDGDTIELVSSDGKTAKIKIAGQEGSVTQGQVIDLNNGQIKVTEVKEGKLKVEVTTTEGSSDSSPSDADTSSESSGDAAQ